MAAYYNEHDPYAAQWLRNLIAEGHIAHGDVDERSIEDVMPKDLAGYTQCHFFAGVGVWSLALRRAGWPDDRPVWTGSCPCQPFSAAGKGTGFADERHLWPAWYHLIKQCRPPILFGEQVASGGGYAWLDVVWSDLEAAGYAVGPVVLPAAGFGAPHARHRLFFVADTDSGRWAQRQPTTEAARHRDPAVATSAAIDDAGRRTTNGYWANADWLPCRDGKRRPVEPGTFPLANGVACRVDKLRAYGNAIVPQVAESFIRAFMKGEKHEHNQAVVPLDAPAVSSI